MHKHINKHCVYIYTYIIYEHHIIYGIYTYIYHIWSYMVIYTYMTYDNTLLITEYVIHM